MDKNIKFIVIGIVILIVGIVIVRGFNSILGGTTHTNLEQFTRGLIVGGSNQPACIKVMDTDKGGYSYITFLNGVEAVTGGAAGAFTIPDACQGK